MGMIHRDLKLANIFASNGVYKIGDFGFGKTLLHEDETISSKLVGTPLYMSPQCLLQKQYTSKTDVWSLGIMLFEILYGDVPWDAPNPAILI
jgi:serine/threonine protein kinase